MKNKILKGIGTLIITSVLITGCSKVPQAEIDSAKSAIEAAYNEGANVYLESNYQALNDSLKSVTEGIEAKKSKLFHSYSDEIKSLTEITRVAGEVKELTITRKEELKNEILFLIGETEKLVGDNQELINQAPRGKEGTTALLAIKGELSIIESTIQSTKDLLQEGDLMQALDKIKAGMEQGKMINTELTEVISKYKSR